MTPQKQFNNLVRFAEDGYEKPRSLGQINAKTALQSLLKTVPVYLVSEEKRVRAMEHAKATIKHFDYGYPQQFCVADDQGVVLVMRNAHTSEGFIVQGLVMICSRMPECPHDIITWGLGQVAIKDASIAGDWVDFLPEKKSEEGWLCAVDKKTFSHGLLFDKGKLVAVPVPPEVDRKELALQDFARSISTAFEEMNYTFKPRVTVVTEEQKKAKPIDWSKRKEIPKAHQRQVHIILDPDEVAVIKRQGEGTHRSPRPHTRRAHMRILRAERFKNARGKVVAIGETEVNVRPGEKIVTPQRIYHVVSVGGEHA